ncbi:MAG: transposase, partial [Oscillospiraceae bacterium]|nr:transposase [Oscillospiraceae bacterium]
FVTICTDKRKKVLSKIIVGDDALDVPQNILTEYGKIADKTLNQMNMFYDYITIEKYVIMPNHIHLILTIENSENGTSRTPSPTNSIVSKFISSFKRFCNREYGERIWQRSFHDHIIRGEKDYKEIWEYIDTNVLKWKDDCMNTNSL